MVGFSYFIPQNIALGLVFFYIVNVVQRGLLGMLAWGGKDETMGAYSQYTDPIIIHQAMGGHDRLGPGVFVGGPAPPRERVAQGVGPARQR